MKFTAMVLAVLAGCAQGAVTRAAPVNVVLVHGIWNDGRVFDPLARRLEEDGCRCFAPDLRPNGGSAGIDDLTRKLAGQIDARFGAGASFYLVGFSMGGIVARNYVQTASLRRRVKGVFLISTGSGGTWWARLSLNAHQRELATGSAFLRALNAQSEAWRSIPVHSYWTAFDLMIVPAVNSRWPASDATQVGCLFHPWMVRNPLVMADIASRLKVLAACSQH